jgi:voltage-gated potassium channel
MMTAVRWNTIWEWPLTCAAVAFLAIYTWQVLSDHQGPSEALGVILTVTWAMFAVDYVGRLYFAQRRWSWFVRHLLDLAIVVLPILRPLRLVRLVILLAVFQRFAGRSLRGRVVVYVAGSTVMLVFVAALAVLDAERTEPAATILTFGDALWWACSTITTVGYGDMSPVSLTGRCVAVALMLGGIALLGTVTATLASWIVQRVAEEDIAGQAATAQQVEALVKQVERLPEQLRLDQAAVPPPSLHARPRRRRPPKVRTSIRG